MCAQFMNSFQFRACDLTLWAEIGKVIGNGVGFPEKNDQSLSLRAWLEAMDSEFGVNFMKVHFAMVLFTH